MLLGMSWFLQKARFFAVYGLCLLSIVPTSRAAEVDLTTAYGLALAKSESLQISVAEWRAAEARYRQALGSMWPEISAKGESKWIHDRDNDTRQAGVGMTWTVFEGFRTVREAEARQAEGLARSYDEIGRASCRERVYVQV
jgi:outer membrane protein TolC